MQPTIKQLNFVLNKKAHMLEDEQKDILWNLYYQMRDHGVTKLGREEQDAWDTYMSLNIMQEQEAKANEDFLKKKIISIVHSKKTTDQSDLEERVTELEGMVKKLCDLIIKHTR